MFPRLTLEIIFNSRFATSNAFAVATKRLLPSHVTLLAIHIYSYLHVKYTTLQRNQLTSFYFFSLAREKCITRPRRMVRSKRNDTQMVLVVSIPEFKFLMQLLSHFLRCRISKLSKFTRLLPSLFFRVFILSFCTVRNTRNAEN